MTRPIVGNERLRDDVLYTFQDFENAHNFFVIIILGGFRATSNYKIV